MKNRVAKALLAAVLLAPAGMVCGQVSGIWSSPTELREKPMEGPAWRAVRVAADRNMSNPQVSNKDDPTNVRVLAAAIVYARNGAGKYRDKVSTAIKTIVDRGHPGGSTLAWAREVGAYALAADLVQYRTDRFEQWLRSIAETWQGTDGRTLHKMFRRRPNNWGTHAFGTLCAIYCYLGDREALSEIRSYWVQGVIGPNPAYRFGSDLSWHVDESNPRIINPPGSKRNGFNIDGFVPDDMRRGGPFRNPPYFTNYAWEVQQGWVMAARILERAGMPIWDVDDQALYRVCYALQTRLGGQWQAGGDDVWMLRFYDEAYGTDFSRGRDVWGAGKNVGWAYVLDNATLAAPSHTADR